MTIWRRIDGKILRIPNNYRIILEAIFSFFVDNTLGGMGEKQQLPSITGEGGGVGKIMNR